MPQFDSFVVFAEMRTGSNFLEANLNALDGVRCHGEAFNPHFIGHPDTEAILDVTLAQRHAEPLRLLAAIRDEPGVMGGFRFFNDHDPRGLAAVLAAPRCAKIILTRNPVESYVSRKIAAATGQWKLTNARHAKSDIVTFDAAGFEQHLAALQAFQVFLLNALQKSGQTAFYVDYEDLQDIEVMNGLALWLGVPGRLAALDRKLKKQNPEPLEEKVANFAAMEQALARLDRFNLGRTPNFEPRRGAAVPSFVAAPDSPLLYMPLRSGPEAALRDWLCALDGGGALIQDFTHKTLRQWKAGHPGHRSFTVLRHPVARAHAAFCERIVATGPGTFGEIRERLRQNFGLPLPQGPVGPDYDAAAHRTAFGVFLTYLKTNLCGQTALRVDPAWASQAAQVQGMAQVAVPDMVLREDRLAEDLAMLCWQIGREDPPDLVAPTDPHAGLLAQIHDRAIESLVREAYGRDYVAFGFGDWAPAA